MSRYGTVLVLALAACLVGPSLAVGQSSTELTVFVWEPTPPISTSDVITLVAWTPERVFIWDWDIEYSTSIVVDDFEIDWSISTSGEAGIGIENEPMICDSKVGPLPAGTYNVTATWSHTGEGLLLNAPSSGIGYTSFTVVPEPSTLAMGLAGAIVAVGLARRRRSGGLVLFSCAKEGAVMSRHGTVLVLALAACLVGPSLAVGQSSTTLILTILEPDGSITDSDVMRIRALTPESVFANSGHTITSSYLVTGPRIDWTIVSEPWDDGIVLPVLEPMGHIGELGPLPAGTYQLYASWNHTGGGLLSGAPSSGIGYTSFTVVPEPSTLVMCLAGAIAVVCVARQRRRPRQAPF